MPFIDDPNVAAIVLNLLVLPTQFVHIHILAVHLQFIIQRNSLKALAYKVCQHVALVLWHAMNALSTWTQATELAKWPGLAVNPHFYPWWLWATSGVGFWVWHSLCVHQEDGSTGLVGQEDDRRSTTGSHDNEGIIRVFSPLHPQNVGHSR